MPDMTPNIHDERERFHSSTYRNQIEEKETLARVDKAFFEKVREYENLVVADAEAFSHDSIEHLEASTEIVSALRDDITRALKTDTAVPDEELARRFVLLRADAEKAIALLESALRASEFHAARCADPQKAHRELLNRFPGIRRPLKL
ncbi:MAG: hypothetical protein ACOH19_03190 [Rhodoglobus sp.]